MIKEKIMISEDRISIHPSEIIVEEFIKPLNMTTKIFAKKMGIDNKLAIDIVEGRTSITKDIAERLSKTFNTSVEFWINLQNNFDKSL
jgi:antitoxin HigA-1